MTLSTQQTDQPVKSAEQKLEDLERFIARRFDEISMEIEATSQLIEMGEEDAQRRFGDMLGAMHAITFSGDGKTSANSGAELESVIKETEDAATRIMDATDRIARRLEDDVPELIGQYDPDIQEIMLACSFQDLVSQRVSMALQSIRHVEERMKSTLEKFGIKIETEQSKIDTSSPHSSAKKNDDFIPDTAQSQDDIDALFD